MKNSKTLILAGGGLVAIAVLAITSYGSSSPPDPVNSVYGRYRMESVGNQLFVIDTADGRMWQRRVLQTGIQSEWEVLGKPWDK